MNYSRSYIMSLAFTGLLFADQANAKELQLVSPNATSQAQHFYQTLTHLPQKPEDRILSGVFGGYSSSKKGAWKGIFGNYQYQEVYKQTGVYPAIYGCDYAQGWKSYNDTPEGAANIIDPSCNELLKELAPKGTIAHISAHLPSPVYSGSNKEGFKKPLTSEEYQRVLTPGTEERKRWLAIMDAMASGLLELQQADVPVLFRPLHEMNGHWFWWGTGKYNSKDPKRRELFIALYRDIFSYMTEVKGLKSLIWVWSPDDGPKYAADYYPGDDYVDIVGLDSYFFANDGTPDFSKVRKVYSELVAFGKPFGLSEMGPKKTNGTFNYHQFILQIEKEFPQVSFFMSWNDGWSPVANLKAKELFNHPWVANAGEY